MTPSDALRTYWTLDGSAVLSALRSGPNGLSTAEAEERLRAGGPNLIESRDESTALRTLLHQLRSPLLLLLVFAATISAGTQQWADAAVVITIVLVTVIVGYRREHSAERTSRALKSRLTNYCRVVRDGTTTSTPREAIVPGDIALLSAGSVVPADCVMVDSTDCYVNEAILTGESFPVLKSVGPSEAGAPLAKRTSCVYMGTNVRSGTARVVVVRTGKATQLGAIAAKLALRAPETEFDRGIRRFGYLLTASMTVLVVVVAVAHLLRGRPAIETILFAVALAVGLTPELLPAILGVNLARGSERLAKRGVLVRRLSAIENLGSMDILCTDKTGTLTEGVVALEGSYDAKGQRNVRALELAALNAALQTGLENPLDEAILKAHPLMPTKARKLGEVPFDFVRKRVSVVIDDEGATRLVVKGAVRQVLDACTRLAEGPITSDGRKELDDLCAGWARDGVRSLAIATKRLAPGSTIGRDDERELELIGFVTFLDRPKQGALEALAALKARGVATKIITGDSRAVTEHVATLVGLTAPEVLTGSELDLMSDEALFQRAQHTSLFVEVDPNQKERIILALKRSGHVVGFLGDGVNDAPAMHAADTSVSVQTAVDVAREAADFVLLEHDLDVIVGGIDEGRRTFANTLKYLLTAMSANLGNMTSMAATSLFLPFLPLLPSQILVINFVSDIPAVGIANDSVDPEMIDTPQRWDLSLIARFTIAFGLLSSLFDLVTFGSLLWVFHAGPDLFRSGWFVESLLTELVVALVVRTRRPFWLSRPGTFLLRATLVLLPLALASPYLPHAGVLRLGPLPLPLVAWILVTTLFYVSAAEVLKYFFFRKTRRASVARPSRTRFARSDDACKTFAIASPILGTAVASGSSTEEKRNAIA